MGYKVAGEIALFTTDTIFCSIASSGDPLSYVHDSSKSYIAADKSL